MPIRKPAGGLKVNGISFWVKDPNAATGLFAAYIRVPGLGSLTLPDESAPQTDTVTLDGSVGSAGFAPVGTIAIPLPVASQHPAHRFLHKIRRLGGNVQFRAVRTASNVSPVAGWVGGTIAAAALTNDLTIKAGLSNILVAATSRVNVKNKVREGHFISVAAAVPRDGDVLDYDAVAASANATFWRGVVEVGNDGDAVTVSPAFPAAVSAAAPIFVRQPGMEWKDINCQVGQMGDGDAQAAGLVAGNLVLRPDVELPVSTLYMSLAE